MANLRGHYIPSVANALLEASDAGTLVARPQGLAMGNAWVSPRACLGQYHLRNSLRIIVIIVIIVLIHMIDGWMGRVFMCNETVLDECYLCLLAQVSFILEFSPLRWPRPWFLWIWRSCNRKLWSGPWRIQGRRSRISRPLCGVDPKGRKPFSQCSQLRPTSVGEQLGRSPATPVVAGVAAGARLVRLQV